MRDNISYGHVVDFETVKKHLFTKQELVEMEKELEESENFGDSEELFTVLCDICRRKKLPQPVMVYTLSEEDSSDFDACIGGLFVVWDERDLYRRPVPKAGFKKLKALGIEPEFSTWNCWG
jgi:hypothetical protein